jgi:hypothetical protein
MNTENCVDITNVARKKLKKSLLRDNTNTNLPSFDVASKGINNTKTKNVVIMIKFERNMLIRGIPHNRIIVNNT